MISAATACSFDLAEVATETAGDGGGGGPDGQPGDATGTDATIDDGGDGKDAGADAVSDSPSGSDGSADAPVDVARDTAPPDTGIDSGPPRVTSGILALYTFKEGTGDVVHDVSGVAPAYDLTVNLPANTTWVAAGLRIDTGAVVGNPGSATKIRTTLQATSEITMEAWVTSSSLTTQSSSGRMIELAKTVGTPNFDLAQVNTVWGGSLRTGAAGAVQFSAASGVTLARTHYVFTRDAGGAWVTYLNAARTNMGTIAGGFGNWDTNCVFTLGNSAGNDRPWLGVMSLAAIYSRALTAQEVQQNYNVGP